MLGGAENKYLEQEEAASTWEAGSTAAGLVHSCGRSARDQEASALRSPGDTRYTR